MRNITFLFIALLFLINNISGQSRWVHQYLGTLNTPGHYLSISYDEGYLLTGRIIPNYQFTWLVKTDVNGEVLWERKIMGYYNRINTDRISQNENGGIFLGGSVTLNDKTDALVMKLNVCGEKEWCRTLITTSNYDFYTDITATPDGGCAAVVINAFHPLFVNRKGLLRFSTDGDLLWQQYYQSPNQGIQDESLSNLLLTPDNGFLMTGYCYYPDPDNPGLSWLHPYYVKTDSLGNFEWEVVLHNETADIGGIGRQTIIAPSGTYYYSCINHYYLSDTLYAKRPALVKMDLQGNVLGVYDLVHDDYDWGGMWSISFINDSLLAGGAGWGYDSETPKSRAIVMDTLGQIKDSITLLNTGWLATTAVTHDGKLLYYNTIEEDGDFDTYLFKLTQDLEQDTFYIRPFVYDSLCPYPIVSDIIVPDDCGVIVGVEENDGEEAWEQGGGEAWGHGGLDIWPNPTSGEIHVRWNMDDGRLNKDFSLMIYDMYGRKMMNSSVPENESAIQLDVGKSPRGIYLIVVRNDSNIIGSSKLVISR
jgi:hypothetical protein